MAGGPSPLPHLHGAFALTTEVYSALLDGTPVPGVEEREATLLQAGSGEP
jgi:hypothetical protein